MAFNFLLAEVCGALQQGLDAEHPEITSRWGGRTYSRTYVTRLLRELGDKEIFLRDWHQERNEETGRTSRFRTFNLNRSHPLVREALVSQWGPDTDTIDHEPEVLVEQSPETSPVEHSLATETVDESPVPASEVEAHAGESTSPSVARPSRPRGRQRQPAEEESQTVGQVPSESGSAEAPAEEATPSAAARPSRRRGRQRQSVEEESQTVDQVPSETGTEEAPAEESTPSATARPSRRRGGQRQAAEDLAPTVELAATGADAEEAQATESQVAEDHSCAVAAPFQAAGTPASVYRGIAAVSGRWTGPGRGCRGGRLSPGCRTGSGGSGLAAIQVQWSTARGAGDSPAPDSSGIFNRPLASDRPGFALEIQRQRRPPKVPCPKALPVYGL